MKLLRVHFLEMNLRCLDVFKYMCSKMFWGSNHTKPQFPGMFASFSLLGAFFLEESLRHPRGVCDIRKLAAERNTTLQGEGP